MSQIFEQIQPSLTIEYTSTKEQEKIANLIIKIESEENLPRESSIESAPVNGFSSLVQETSPTPKKKRSYKKKSPIESSNGEEGTN